MKQLYIKQFFTKLKNSLVRKNVTFTTPYSKEVETICIILQENFLIRGIFSEPANKKITIYLHYDAYGMCTIRDVTFNFNIVMSFKDISKLNSSTIYIFNTTKGIYTQQSLYLNHLNGTCIAAIKRL